MFRKLCFGVMPVLCIICLIASPICSIIGIFTDYHIDGIWLFHLFTLIDLILLFNFRHKLLDKLRAWPADRKNRKTIVLLAFLLAVVLAIALVPGIIKERDLKRIQTEAETLINQGQYEEAYSLLSDCRAQEEYANVQEYPSLYGLQTLCRAYIESAKGNLQEAYDAAFSYCYYVKSEDRCESHNAFASKVISDYHEWDQHMRSIGRRDPFVGMSESDISNTQLGEYDWKWESDKTSADGKNYKSTTYFFREDRTTIFTATCIDGEVVSIEDKRDEEKSAPSNKSSAYIPSHGYAWDDEEYYDAEDFYDEYYDEFDSFEEAEDYFYDYVY